MRQGCQIEDTCGSPNQNLQAVPRQSEINVTLNQVLNTALWHFAIELHGSQRIGALIYFHGISWRMLIHFPHLSRPFRITASRWRLTWIGQVHHLPPGLGMLKMVVISMGDHRYGGFHGESHIAGWCIGENPKTKWMMTGVPLWLRKPPSIIATECT